MTDDSTQPPEPVDPLEARFLRIEARLDALERRPRDKPPKGLEWALRPTVAARIRPDVLARAHPSPTARPRPAAPMLEDAARDAGGWPQLLQRIDAILGLDALKDAIQKAPPTAALTGPKRS